MYDYYTTNIFSGIEQTRSLSVAGPCGFSSVEGAEMQLRVMKNLRMDKWDAMGGRCWHQEDLNSSTQLIVSELIRRGFESLNQDKDLQSFIKRLVGWAAHPKKQNSWSSYETSRTSQDIHLLEETRCIHRIEIAWKRVLEKKVNTN